MLAHLFYLVTIGLFAVLHKPSVILRPQWVARLSAAQGIHWSDLDIQSHSTGFLKPAIRISWKAARIDTPTLHATTGPGQIAFVLDFRQLHPSLSKIETIQIADAVIEPVSAPTAPPASSKPISLPPWVSSFKKAQIGPVWIQVAEWRIGGDQGSATLRHFHEGAQWRWRLRARESAHHATAVVDAQSPTHELEGAWNLRVNARTGSSSLIRRAWLRGCELTLKGSTELQLVHCPLGVSARLPHVTEVPKLRFLRFNDRIEAILTARLSSSDLFDLNRRVQMKSELKLRPILPAGKARGIGRIVGGLRVAGNLVPSDPTRKWHLRSALDLQLRIDHFHRLVAFLNPTKFAIPAPFASLRGHMLLQANGEVSSDQAKVPLVLRTRLNSQGQAFDVDASGTLLARRISLPLHPHLELTLTLTDISIPLPHLELAGLPQLLPDQRITSRPLRSETKQEAGKAPSASQPTYHVVVKTGKKPILIHTNLAKAPIPVRLDVALDSGRKPLGKIHVDSFPLDLFRRDAEFRSFDLDLQPKEEKISGLVRVQYTDYTIYIHLFGTVDQPGYSFTSDPPLSDSDVISVLLFGQTSEDLDAGESQSVGSVRSAVAGRGLGLASMYLLASTPIESVGYDPESGTVTIRFRLASGTSLNVTEGQQNLQSVGIRHRIGRHWAITTQLGNPADPTDKSISALFQWSHRY